MKAGPRKGQMRAMPRLSPSSERRQLGRRGCGGRRQVGAGDRIAVRVVARFAELRRDQLLEVLGDVVLEHLRLGVDAVARHPQGFGEEGLDQAVMADHLERDPLACRGQADSLVGDVLGEAEVGELLEHRGRRRGGDAETGRDLAVGDEAFAVVAEHVDGLGVVLDRLRVRHV
jgi:hypothetical protein